MSLALSSVDNVTNHHKPGGVKFSLINIFAYLVVTAMLVLWPAGSAVAQSGNFNRLTTASSSAPGPTSFSSAYTANNSQGSYNRTNGALTPASAGDSSPAGGFSMWATPVYQNHRASDLKSDNLTLGNFQLGRFTLGPPLPPLAFGPVSIGDISLGDFKYGYDTNLYGGSLGADYTTSTGLHLGLAFNVGGGKSDTTDDLAGIRNDFDYYGLNLYTGYNFNNFSLHADLGYTVSTNDMNIDNMKFKFGHLFGVGPLTANADASADTDSQLFTAGLRGEYLLATDSLDIIPHLGVRVNYLRIDDYNTHGSLSGIAIAGASMPIGSIAFNYTTPAVSTTMVQFPMGITLAKSFETQSGWSIRPGLDLGVLFTIGDDNFTENITIPGIATSADMNSGIHDEVTFQGGLGIAMSYNNDLNLALDYNLNYSEHLTSSGLFATMEYKF